LIAQSADLVSQVNGLTMLAVVLDQMADGVMMEGDHDGRL